jgi:putative transposase
MTEHHNVLLTEQQAARYLNGFVTPATSGDNPPMNTVPSIYRGFCFPAEVISHAVFLYHRYSLSLRDVEDLLAYRGITVSYETIRRWCRRFGPHIARNLRRKQGTLGDQWFMDEVFVNIQGQCQYLWRAIDQNGDVIDILLQRRRNALAAKRFFRRIIKRQQRSPNRLVTDKLGSYRVAHREEIPGVPHDTTQYANNRIEASHRRTRIRERQMLGFRSVGGAQRFLSVQLTVLNLFNWTRHKTSAERNRFFRAQAFNAWAVASYV